MLSLEPIPYASDSAPLFGRLTDLDWPVFLDSGVASGNASHARFDILSAAPYVRMLVQQGVTTVLHAKDQQALRENPLDVLRDALGPRADAVADLPFVGGAIGFFSYDLGRTFERLPTIARDDRQVPDMIIGLYDWAVVIDHHKQESWLVRQGRDRLSASEWGRIRNRVLGNTSGKTELAPLKTLAPFQSNMDFSAYAQALTSIQALIRAGDCYQVNFTQRFSAPVAGDAWHAYQLLRQQHGTPFGAFMRFDQLEILSLSPERFLQLHGAQVTTEPIKGTRPRALDPWQDQQEKDALVSSLKDRAENLMIVDLLRNDLGRVCVPGSIQVPELFRLDSFSAVHHLTSRITGQLRSDKDALDLLQACFPGGSVTGAPKIRAMEIIESLEPCRRGLYCGAIGYIGFDGRMDTNIAIRTLVCQQHDGSSWAYYGVGGGITSDSDCAEEYQESLDKARVFRSFFGS